MHRTYRTVHFYSLNARHKDELLNYADFVKKLSLLEAEERTVLVDEELAICISHIQEMGEGEFGFIILGGDPADSPIIFNPTTGDVERIDLGDEKFIASSTNAALLIDGDSRVMSMEIRRNGISQGSLERYLGIMSEKIIGKRYTFDMIPFAGEKFFDQIKSFSLIKEVTVSITRPNRNWNPIESRLEELGNSSGGHRVSVTVTAERGGGLDPEEGVMSLIKDEETANKAKIKSATVKGLMRGASVPVSISTSRSVAKEKISFGSSGSLIDKFEASVRQQFTGIYDLMLRRPRRELRTSRTERR